MNALLLIIKRKNTPLILIVKRSTGELCPWRLSLYPVALLSLATWLRRESKGIEGSRKKPVEVF